MLSGRVWSKTGRGCSMLSVVTFACLLAALPGLLPAAQAKSKKKGDKAPAKAAEESDPWYLAAKQFHNESMRDWVAERVQPLAFAYETALMHDWRTLWADAPGKVGKEVADGDVVLLTQASPERLPFIRNQLILWGGPASVTVYIPMPHTMSEAAVCRQRVIDHFSRTMELLERGRPSKRPPPLAVTMLYAREQSPVVHCDVDETADGLAAGWTEEGVWEDAVRNRPYLDIYDMDYPIGTLRQLAFQLIPDHKFVFLLDSDFTMMPNFSAKVTTDKSGSLLALLRSSWQQRQDREALVIPAFERRSRPAKPSDSQWCCSLTDASLDDGVACPCWLLGGKYDVPLTMRHVAKGIEKGDVQPFHQPKHPNSAYPMGQRCYNTTRVFVDFDPYVFEYGHPCEPYFIALKAAMPAFDERWRGRELGAVNLEKVNYVTHMAVLNTQFWVEPDFFVVHAPHPPAQQLLDSGKKRLPDAMAGYQVQRLEVPMALTRVFFTDISQQPDAHKAFTPWMPWKMKRKDVLALNEVMAEDRSKRKRKYKVSPWNSGLPFCVSKSQIGTHEAREAVAFDLKFDPRYGCMLRIPDADYTLELPSEHRTTGKVQFTGRTQGSGFARFGFGSMMLGWATVPLLFLCILYPDRLAAWLEMGSRALRLR